MYGSDFLDDPIDGGAKLQVVWKRVSLAVFLLSVAEQVGGYELSGGFWFFGMSRYDVALKV